MLPLSIIKIGDRAKNTTILPIIPTTQNALTNGCEPDQ